MSLFDFRRGTLSSTTCTSENAKIAACDEDLKNIADVSAAAITMPGDAKHELNNKRQMMTKFKIIALANQLCRVGWSRSMQYKSMFVNIWRCM